MLVVSVESPPVGEPPVSGTPAYHKYRLGKAVVDSRKSDLFELAVQETTGQILIRTNSKDGFLRMGRLGAKAQVSLVELIQVFFVQHPAATEFDLFFLEDHGRSSYHVERVSERVFKIDFLGFQRHRRS